MKPIETVLSQSHEDRLANFVHQDSLARRFLEIDISENDIPDPESMLMGLFEGMRE